MHKRGLANTCARLGSCQTKRSTRRKCFSTDGSRNLRVDPGRFRSLPPGLVALARRQQTAEAPHRFVRGKRPASRAGTRLHHPASGFLSTLCTLSFLACLSNVYCTRFCTLAKRLSKWFLGPNEHPSPNMPNPQAVGKSHFECRLKKCEPWDCACLPPGLHMMRSMSGRVLVPVNRVCSLHCSKSPTPVDM